MKKKVLFPVLLMGMTLPLALGNKFTANNAEFIGDYSQKNAYTTAGSKVNEQICDEGFVLLKNENNFLPMKGNEKISLVGKSSGNLVRGGGGSGSGSVNGEENWQLTRDSGGNAEIKGSLEEAGFEVNKEIQKFYGKWTSGGWGGLTYSNDSKSGSGRTNGNDSWKGNSEVTIGETPISSYSAELLATLDEYKDAAIQVISREGSEGCDVKTCNAHDSKKTNSSAEKVSDRHALQLSENEEALFNELHKHTDNIIIIINSGNIFECSKFENDDKVKAILWIGNPGAVGAKSVGKILKGEVNPSGRTVDTWARDFTKDPTYQNFSDNSQTNLVTSADGKQYYAPQDTMFAADGAPMMSFGTDKSYKDHNAPRWDNARGGEEAKVVAGGINGVKPSAYVSYEEGIYIDYRYHETRYADMAEKDKAAADEWYNGQEGVVYPFGYGLSYTSFTQEIVKSNIKKGGKINQKNEVISFTVKVTNTGSVAGKDAVQLYWKAPYKKGGIEKADHVLCAFDKSKMLEPGESQEISLSFHLQDVANYDFSDANKNKFCGYELDAGKYAVKLMKNAHEAYEDYNFQVSKNIKYKTDRFSGNEVKNRFTDRGWYSSMPGKDDIEFTQMSRADFVGTFPTHPTIADRTVKEGSKFEEFLTHEFQLGEVDVAHDYRIIPEAAARTEQDAINGNWQQAATAKAKGTGTQLIDMKGVALDDPKWNDFINEFTYDELLKYIEQNRMSSIAQENIGKQGFTEGDGPQKLKSAGGIMWVSSPIIAATFNPDLAHKQGECVGMESNLGGESGWWGPAVNTHRSPFGGRNFEYYSADPLISGKIGGRVVAGATDGGLYCFFKHFCVNDQEKNREGVSAFLTEQALREIYLKAFQYVVQEGKATGIMSSYNRIGLMESAASYPLLTEVLRNEWGFKGQVFSDMTHHSNSAFDRKYYENINNRILAGDSQQLDGSSYKNDVLCSWDPQQGCPTYNGTPSYSWWYAVRKAAHDTMYSAAKCAAIDKSKVTNAHITIEGQKDLRYTKAVDEEVNIKLNVPEQYASYELAIDPFTPLPEGLSLNDNVISGSSDVPVNKFIHVMVMAGTQAIAGTSIELLITAVGDNAETEDYVDPKPGGKKGCFGGFEISMIAMSAISVLALGVLLINKKRKIAE